jgi:quercetin dioxygenase-like cupin family protein
MTPSHQAITDLIGETEIPAQGILSRSLVDTPHLKVVLFGFAKGEELSEHTAAMPATIHFLQGKASLTLGGETMVATQGTWTHMDAHLPHSIRALEPTLVLLSLVKGGKTKRGD